MIEITVYLAGHIHGTWREDLRQGAQKRGLPIQFVGPQEDHGRSDGIGVEVLGDQPDAVFKDEAASQINNLRTRILLNKADVVVACFQDQFRQWNTAMDAGIALAGDKPLILVRPKGLHHALKELANRAQVVCEELDQVLDTLAYIHE